MGITCNDVGELNGRKDGCSDDISAILRGYEITSDSVFPHIVFDRDILQVNVLATMGAWESALDLYAYGHNVVVGGSLNSLKDLVVSKIDTLHLGDNFQGFAGNFDAIDEYINAALVHRCF
jgi:hypothetical protein